MAALALAAPAAGLSSCGGIAKADVNVNALWCGVAAAGEEGARSACQPIAWQRWHSTAAAQEGREVPAERPQPRQCDDVIKGAYAVCGSVSACACLRATAERVCGMSCAVFPPRNGCAGVTVVACVSSARLCRRRRKAMLWDRTCWRSSSSLWLAHVRACLLRGVRYERVARGLV